MKRTSSSRQTHARWWRSPFDVAVLRIVVCGLVLWFLDIDRAIALAATSRDLVVVEPGWAFPLAWLPMSPRAAEVSGYVLFAGCALGLVGIWTRAALAAAFAAGLYHLGVPQHLGAVEHYHHLLWLLAVLAASPCADVLSVDAARAAAAGTTRPPRRALRYGLPVWTARVLIGVIFFFPGIHKLAESGVAWALSDNLRNQMYWKWFQHDAMSWRIDRYPRLMQGMAAAAVVFELTALPLMFWRRARPFVAAAGFVFHMATDLLMHISFGLLWPCYVVVLDTHRVLRELAAEVFPTKLVVTAPAPDVAALRSVDVLGRVIYRVGDRSWSWPALMLRSPLAPLALFCAHAPRKRKPARSPRDERRRRDSVDRRQRRRWCHRHHASLAARLLPHLSVDGRRRDPHARRLRGATGWQRRRARRAAAIAKIVGCGVERDRRHPRPVQPATSRQLLDGCTTSPSGGARARRGLGALLPRVRVGDS